MVPQTGSRQGRLRHELDELASAAHAVSEVMARPRSADDKTAPAKLAEP